ncbi:MAG: 2-phospho-L-lactate transferase [Proteobacteria bacterium]|nr:2-phospho-L-lactate transferase [Pseudomonadota bacterium]
MDGGVVAISGGIGGAKLALGLYRVLPKETLTVIVNCGDDFDHLGLRICPDIDTTLYTLGGLANTELGWGRRDETWSFMETLGALGGETWFRLGDRDLALHAERTRRLAAGESLSALIADIAGRFRIRAAIVPMSDEPVRTRVQTSEGELAFQDYFVRRRCAPQVSAIRFEGAARARPSAPAAAALAAHPAALILCPSNPYLSVDPILSVPGLRDLIRGCGAPVIAVSPLVGGDAVKGPTGKIMRELGVPLTAAAIARHYQGLLDGFVVDERDPDPGDLGCPVHVTNTLMKSLEDREELAREVLQFATRIGTGR